MKRRKPARPVDARATRGAAPLEDPAHPAVDGETGDQPDTDHAADAGRRPAGARRPLAAGLHLLSTPIGSARDITLRGLDALETADMLVAEDTRTLRRLMDLHGVSLGDRPLISYHDHNAAGARPRILERLAEGASVVYASDAGTPLIADPGWKLAREARAAGSAVTALPGACAAIDALVLSGAPTDAFAFMGFPPTKSGARRAHFARWATAPGALIFYESPRRLAESLEDLAAALGPRQAAVARELTKLFEEVRRDSLEALIAHYREAGAPKGEVVVVVDPAEETEPDRDAIEAAVREALETMSARDAARTVAERLGVGRKEVYALAVDLSKGDSGEA